jgi:hypothetical protein
MHVFDFFFFFFDFYGFFLIFKGLKKVLLLIFNLIWFLPSNSSFFNMKSIFLVHIIEATTQEEVLIVHHGSVKAAIFKQFLFVRHDSKRGRVLSIGSRCRVHDLNGVKCCKTLFQTFFELPFLPTICTLCPFRTFFNFFSNFFRTRHPPPNRPSSISDLPDTDPILTRLLTLQPLSPRPLALRPLVLRPLALLPLAMPSLDPRIK